MIKKKYPNIIKRSGEEVPFNSHNIYVAIKKANEDKEYVDEIHRMSDIQIRAVTQNVCNIIEKNGYAVSVEEVSDIVEKEIANMRAFEVAKAYILYRYQHAINRDFLASDFVKGVMNIVEQDENGQTKNSEAKTENANKNVTLDSTQRDYIAGWVSKKISDYLFPNDVILAHHKGIIHIHDLDYFIQKMFNCCVWDLESILNSGTVITKTLIESPHSFSTACNIATQVVAQLASAQYGGQTWTLTHLAPFVDVSRKAFRKEVTAERKANGDDLDKEKIERTVESRLQKEIEKGCQIIQYQLTTLMTTNGQAPFVTIFMYINEAKDKRTREDLVRIIREVIKQRLQGVKNEKGIWITPAFPKLIYVLDEDNAYPGTKYFDVTREAAVCTAKRLVPDYISAKKMKELKGDVYPCMGCRSFLTPSTDEDWFNEPGKPHKYYGRFNQGVCSINLPYIACLANGNEEKFWEVFEEYLEMCHKVLQIRHKRLEGTIADTAPVHFRYGALARLEQGETIDKLLYGNYSTISLGYAGLYECTMRIKGVSHTDPKGHDFAIAVMQKMNDKCAEWRAAENISYSLYGTPLESTTYKFAKALKNDFGIIKDVSDHNYITNSYHVNVRENIDAFKKLGFEAEFQALSPGGAISYVEVPDMNNNIEAVLTIMQYIYENIMYAEINTKSDCCSACGYEGEIQCIEDNTGKLIWKCPNCGCTDESQLHVARRTCGYIGTEFWNQGRTQEIKDRVIHVSQSKRNV